MLSEKFYDVIDHEGSVSITSWTKKRNSCNLYME